MGSDRVDTSDLAETDPEVRPLPATARGRRRRQSLLDAAREVFARDGFANARITDIADTANTAHGSFYTYFASKEEIFVALLRELEEELRSPGPRDVQQDGDGSNRVEPYEQILRANRAYLTAYRKNRAIMVAWEQVATLDAGVERLRREASDRFVQRIEKSVRHWQDKGIADPDVDPVYAAMALTGMVSNFAYRWSARDADYEVGKAAEQLSLLWANSLGIRTPRGPGETSISRSRSGRQD
ncbi:TetR/AcrR family transcriptional regulator [Streptomyces viridosporus]|uniref:TetR/AcrR family transcriptional regulator n=1 Tax=Streptomyces viridosporus TaxID=67581 RepID=UPI00332D7380